MPSLKAIVLSLVCSFILALADPTPNGKSHGHDKNCLKDHEAQDIVNRYTSMFEARDPAVATSIADSLVTDDYSIEDETVNFFFGSCVFPPEGPYATNKSQFIATLQGRLAASAVGPEKFTVLKIISNCDSIAFRWRDDTTALGIPPNTAHPGDPVHYKGIDMLDIDLNSRRIKKTVSSADWFWYAYYVGAKVVFQKYNFPACLCQDPVPGLDSNGQCTATP